MPGRAGENLIYLTSVSHFAGDFQTLFPKELRKRVSASGNRSGNGPKRELRKNV